MDFREDASTRAFRDEVRAVIADHLTPEVHERVERTGTHHDWAMHRALAACRGGLNIAVVIGLFALSFWQG